MHRPKPYNSNQWTKARMRSFIMSALRKARWPVKYESIKKAYVEDGINPATGRKCKLHRCESCGNLFPQSQMVADHIHPVVPVDGFSGEKFVDYNWTLLIQRLYCELGGLQAVCKPCHKIKTDQERKERNIKK